MLSEKSGHKAKAWISIELVASIKNIYIYHVPQGMVVVPFGHWFRKVENAQKEKFS